VAILAINVEGDGAWFHFSTAMNAFHGLILFLKSSDGDAVRRGELVAAHEGYMLIDSVI
jgi:hypothetical protein